MRSLTTWCGTVLRARLSGESARRARSPACRATPRSTAMPAGRSIWLWCRSQPLPCPAFSPTQQPPAQRRSSSCPPASPKPARMGAYGRKKQIADLARSQRHAVARTELHGHRHRHATFVDGGDVRARDGAPPDRSRCPASPARWALPCSTMLQRLGSGPVRLRIGRKQRRYHDDGSPAMVGGRPANGRCPAPRRAVRRSSYVRPHGAARLRPQAACRRSSRSAADPATDGMVHDALPPSRHHPRVDARGTVRSSAAARDPAAPGREMDSRSSPMPGVRQRWQPQARGRMAFASSTA